MDVVFAVRQPLSAPTWEKPMVIWPPPPPPPDPPDGAGPLPHAARTPAVAMLSTAVRTFFTTTPSLVRIAWLGRLLPPSLRSPRLPARVPRAPDGQAMNVTGVTPPGC